jgi:hypothetical protein
MLTKLLGIEVHDDNGIDDDDDDCAYTFPVLPILRVMHKRTPWIQDTKYSSRQNLMQMENRGWQRIPVLAYTPIYRPYMYASIHIYTHIKAL